MTTTVQPPSLEDLGGTQLPEAYLALENAEAEFSAAAYSGQRLTGARKQLENARAEVDRIEAAITEAERRAQSEAAEAEVQEISDRRRAFYSWGLDWAAQLDRVAEAKAVLAQVEAEATETWRACPRFELVTRHSERFVSSDPAIGRADHFIEQTELDAEAVRSIPTLIPTSQPKPGDIPWDADRRSELVERLTALVEAEQTPEAVVA